jgi:glycerol-3-phosphate acyltransferase PlsY
VAALKGGVATACGVFSILTPVAVPPALLIFFWRRRLNSSSLGSMLATIALPHQRRCQRHSTAALAAACASSVLILFRHRGNFVRLRAGSERRLGARA